MQAIPTLEIEAVVDASTCKDFSCDKCDGCVSKARWDKKGSDWARKCASKASGKLFLWASWQKEGVGCLCCCNHLLAKQKKHPMVQGTKFATFRARPKCVQQLIDHEKHQCHQDALSFHITGSLKEDIEIIDDGSDDLKPKGKVGLPTGSALCRLVRAVEQHVSLDAFVKSECESHKEEGFHSIQVCVDALSTLADTQRHFWFRRLFDSAILLSSDAVGNSDIVDFQAVDKKLDVFVGSFGLCRNHLALNQDRDSKPSCLGPGEDGLAAQRLATAVGAAVVEFCNQAGASDDAQIKKVKDNVRGIMLMVQVMHSRALDCSQLRSSSSASQVNVMSFTITFASLQRHPKKTQTLPSLKNMLSTRKVH